MAVRPKLISSIRKGGFGILLTWQRFYPMQKDILEAIQESGIKTIFMDFGFLPHYNSVVFDSLGENASSSWPESWKNDGFSDLTDEQIQEAALLVQSEASRARLLKLPELAEEVPLPFLFVPLQRPSDAVIKFDSSVHDSGKLLRRTLFLATGKLFVVAKPHPLDWDKSLGIPDRIDGSHLVIRSKFDEANELLNDYLLSRASLVVGVNSNMLFRAILFGTPIIACGRGWYSNSGALYELKGINHLHSLSAPPVSRDSQIRYVAACLTRQLTFENLDDPDKLLNVLCRIGVIRG